MGRGPVPSRPQPPALFARAAGGGGLLAGTGVTPLPGSTVRGSWDGEDKAGWALSPCRFTMLCRAAAERSLDADRARFTGGVWPYRVAQAQGAHQTGVLQLLHSTLGTAQNQFTPVHSTLVDTSLPH